jgi:hypothetical protein
VRDTLLRVIDRRRLAGLLAVVALFCSGLLLASCGSDDETTTTTEAPPPPVTVTTTITMPPGTPARPTEISIVVVDGAPKGGIVREKVEKNDLVVLVVRSDVADHVHLHGYDVMRDVAPGKPARLPFKATIPGVFEVELEDRGLQIADITVQP